MEVLTGQRYEAMNLISFRKRGRAAEIQSASEKLLDFMRSKGASKVGSGISTTHAVEGDTMDVEVYIPIDIEVSSSNEFLFKQSLILENCIKVNYKGNPSGMKNTLQEISEYIAKNEITPISSGFLVTQTEVHTLQDIEKFEVDIFIPVQKA